MIPFFSVPLDDENGLRLRRALAFLWEPDLGGSTSCERCWW